MDSKLRTDVSTCTQSPCPGCWSLLWSRINDMSSRADLLKLGQQQPWSWSHSMNQVHEDETLHPVHVCSVTTACSVHEASTVTCNWKPLSGASYHSFEKYKYMGLKPIKVFVLTQQSLFLILPSGHNHRVGDNDGIAFAFCLEIHVVWVHIPTSEKK